MQFNSSVLLRRCIIGLSLVMASIGCQANTSYPVMFYNSWNLGWEGSTPMLLSGPLTIHDRTGEPWGDISYCMKDWDAPTSVESISPLNAYRFSIRDKNDSPCINNEKAVSWVVDVKSMGDWPAATIRIMWRHAKINGNWSSRVDAYYWDWPNSKGDRSYDLSTRIFALDGRGNNILNTWNVDHDYSEPINITITPYPREKTGKSDEKISTTVPPMKKY